MSIKRIWEAIRNSMQTQASITRTIHYVEMTPEQKVALDQAFAAMDGAFKEMDKVFRAGRPTR